MIIIACIGSPVSKCRARREKAIHDLRDLSGTFREQFPTGQLFILIAIIRDSRSRARAIRATSCFETLEPRGLTLV